MKRISEFLGQLQWTVKHPDWAWYVVQQYRTHKQEGEDLARTLVSLELLTSKEAKRWGIGTALTLAGRLSIDPRSGLTGYECLAVLESKHWTHNGSPETIPRWCKLFRRKKPETEESIEGWSIYPDIAIAKCAIKAKKAGVI